MSHIYGQLNPMNAILIMFVTSPSSVYSPKAKQIRALLGMYAKP